jgi:enoyl-CoA hydratase/carnithine racemase
MADELFKVERHGSYATFTLNRPEKRNSLNEPMLKALDEAVASVENDKGIRAVILRGNGRGFCSGIDLAEAERLEGGHNRSASERNLQAPREPAGRRRGSRRRAGRRLRAGVALRPARCGRRLRMGMTVARVGLVVPYNFIRKTGRDHRRGNTSQILYTPSRSMQRTLQMGMVHSEWCPVAKLDEAAIGWAEKEQCAALAAHDEEELPLGRNERCGMTTSSRWVAR